MLASDLNVCLILGAERRTEFSVPLHNDATLEIAAPDIPLLWKWRSIKHNDILRFDAKVVNTGRQPLFFESARIVFKAAEKGSAADWRVFLDAGECAWCGVKKLDALGWSPAFDVIAEQRIKEPNVRSGQFHRSSLQTVLYDAAGRQTWLFGFLGQGSGYNGVDIYPDAVQSERLDRIEAWQLPGTLLEPGRELLLDPLVILMETDPLAQLERYANLVQMNHGREFGRPPVVGMMTWYGYRTAIDRGIILQNADLVAELFGGYPQSMQQLMLLDHGWQPDANWGCWDEADEGRFPEGMEWLGGQLRERGLALGLWYTPFCITENCPTSDAIHPMVARDQQGNPYESAACVWGQLPGHTADDWPIQFLDGGRDDVQAKWAEEMTRMALEWDCVYWKLDFFALITSAHSQRSTPTGELYARTYRTFRQAAGEEAHLAPCSCDTNIQLGHNDSIRIAADIGNAGTWPGRMPDYARGFTTIASLWYKHRRFWVNDPDSIQVGCGCGLNEARVRATVVAFSGGHMMISEDLRWTSPERIEMVRRLLPAYGVAARPLDLFENVYPDDLPHIWRLPVQSNWDACDAIALFNLTDEVKRVTVQPEWFGLNGQQFFGVAEWWHQRWLGQHKGPFEVVIPPADVAVLHAQAFRSHPWLVSVSHHFTGGWIVENLCFDDAQQQLHGELVTKPALAMSLMGTLPPQWYIPPNADYHGRGNGAGGWAHEVRTDSQRTPFTIQFARTV